MSISIHVSFLLLLVIVMCFSNSTFGSRVSIPLNSPSQAGKILMFSIQNDLPRDSEALHFHIVNEKPEYLLKLGEPVDFVSNCCILASNWICRKPKIAARFEAPWHDFVGREQGSMRWKIVARFGKS